MKTYQSKLLIQRKNLISLCSTQAAHAAWAPGPGPQDQGATSDKQQASRKSLTGPKLWDIMGYVSFFKTRVPTRRRESPVHPGQGCGIHSGSQDGHPEFQARVPVGRGRAVIDRIFGMPQPGYQWRRSEGRIMEFELIPSGPGASAPGPVTC